MKFKEGIPYVVEIKPTQNNAIVVRVGCCTLAYPIGDSEEIDFFLCDLRDYLEDPTKVITEHQKFRHTDCRPPDPPDGGGCAIASMQETTQGD